MGFCAAGRVVERRRRFSAYYSRIDHRLLGAERLARSPMPPAKKEAAAPAAGYEAAIAMALKEKEGAALQ